MWQNPQETADFIIFTEEIFNGKLHFLCSIIFLTTPDEVEKYAKIMQSISSDKYVHHYNIKILNLFVY